MDVDTNKFHYQMGNLFVDDMGWDKDLESGQIDFKVFN